ncbi:MAG: recD, partial [Proteobacteria bacterium]|nr:recD [Pseudomonadota bacterium]
GAVLGELCRRARDGHYIPANRDWLQAATGEPIDPSLLDGAGTALDQAVVMLRHSRRFSADSGIGRLAEAVNAGDTAALRKIRKQGHADLALLRLAGGDDPDFRALVIDGGVAGRQSDDLGRPHGEKSPPVRRGYRHYLEIVREKRPPHQADRTAFDCWALEVLRAHGEFQVLCALRHGPWGVEGLNQRIARLLQKAELIPASEGWYCGRPVLVTRNDYGLGLMNGDIGITLALPGGEDDDWILRVAFPSGDGTGGIKWVLPSRLQAVETVYALTVHKSQGSEFTHAAVVLPETANPILTRELLYTGITRARSFLTLAQPGAETLLEEAAQRRVLRASGLLAE